MPSSPFDFSPLFWEHIRAHLYGPRGRHAIRRTLRGLHLEWDRERCEVACNALDLMLKEDNPRNA